MGWAAETALPSPAGGRGEFTRAKESESKQTGMSPRVKKLIGLFVLLPALLVYFGGVVTLADRVPSFWLAKLVYFIATGLAWAVPVIPFMKWMEKAPDKNKKGAE